jgi:hypothetical protein
LAPRTWEALVPDDRGLFPLRLRASATLDQLENSARRNLAGRLSGRGRAARCSTRKTCPASATSRPPVGLAVNKGTRVTGRDFGLRWVARIRQIAPAGSAESGRCVLEPSLPDAIASCVLKGRHPFPHGRGRPRFQAAGAFSLKARLCANRYGAPGQDSLAGGANQHLTILTSGASH